MTKLSSVRRRRWVFLPVGLLVVALAVALPMAVLAASAGGVEIRVNAVNLSTALGDDGSVGDRLKLRVSDPSGTDFTSLVGKAKFIPAVGPVEVFNITGSTPISAGDFGMIEFTDILKPGYQIFVGLATGPVEVRVVIPGPTPKQIRFHSGEDKLGLKIKVK